MCIHIWEAPKSWCVLGIISGKLLSPAELHPRLFITTGAGHVPLLGQTRAGVTSWGTTGLSEHPELTNKTFPTLTSPLCSPGFGSCSGMGALSWVLGMAFVILQGRTRDVTLLSLCWKSLLPMRLCTCRAGRSGQVDLSLHFPVYFFLVFFCLYSLPTAVTHSNICYDGKFLSVVHSGELFHGRIHRNQCRE